ncbi:MAG: tRNA pseudouridine(38-40) synthase TruA [Bacteroidetes bacterium]|nr:tRNA pseudouridine(38-40) synthase TruA [Bacteroidota bacterium]
MSRYFIKLSYNGSRYHGWQMQENAVSIQDLIQKGLSFHTGEQIELTGCGRTDTGVHAREYYAHFDLNRDQTPDFLEYLVYKLNSFLPDDIAVYEIFPVPKELHARFDAISRTYEYQVLRKKDPFLEDFAYYLYGELDVDRMNEGAALLLKYDDFTSFSKLHTQVKTNICHLMHARWEESGNLLVFTIKADRFLRNMVRAIVGTLLDLGRSKITLEDLIRIIEVKDRSAAGFSVPAKGLFLTGVEYIEPIPRPLSIDH